MENNFPQIGDVITSPDFAYGWWNNARRERIRVDGKTTGYTDQSSISEDLRVQAAALTGDVPPKYVTRELGVFDPSRGTAEFVVEQTNNQDGSTGGGMNQHDDYPGGWHILARRMKENGEYDPQ